MSNEEETNTIQREEASLTASIPLTGQAPVLEEYPSFAPSPEQLVKGLIFASSDFLSAQRIKELTEGALDLKTIRQAVKTINAKFIEHDEPYEIFEANNSYRFRTKSEYHPWIKKLFKESSARRLSQAALEILSIVSYKQPITKAEIEDIRGVNVDGTLKGLLDRKLVAIAGKSDKIGNPFNYGTTKLFLQYFGINSINQDLPKLSEFEELIQSAALLPQVSPEGELEEFDQDEVEEEAEV